MSFPFSFNVPTDAVVGLLEFLQGTPFKNVTVVPVRDYHGVLFQSETHPILNLSTYDWFVKKDGWTMEVNEHPYAVTVKVSKKVVGHNPMLFVAYFQ